MLFVRSFFIADILLYSRTIMPEIILIHIYITTFRLGRILPNYLVYRNSSPLFYRDNTPQFSVYRDSILIFLPNFVIFYSLIWGVFRFMVIVLPRFIGITFPNLYLLGRILPNMIYLDFDLFLFQLCFCFFLSPQVLPLCLYF